MPEKLVLTGLHVARYAVPGLSWTDPLNILLISSLLLGEKNLSKLNPKFFLAYSTGSPHGQEPDGY